jgi:hypothetical protein
LEENKRLGIIVPFRKRENHLIQFVPHMKARMPQTRIYIIEQFDNKPFNRAKLLNIGFQMFHSEFDYFAAHDIDLLPVKANYAYPLKPTHLATKAEQFGYKMPYAEYFGGVTLFNNGDFVTVNGYSNFFWGWGGEDDEMYKRCMETVGVDSRECTFKSLPHARKIDPNLHKVNVEKINKQRGANDGLTFLDYELKGSNVLGGYHHIKVEL